MSLANQPLGLTFSPSSTSRRIASDRDGRSGCFRRHSSMASNSSEDVITGRAFLLGRNQLLRLGLCGDLAQWRSAMHHDLAILKDPFFWGAMLLVVLPMAMTGAALVWWDSWPD
jgi:hypothetical protein